MEKIIREGEQFPYYIVRFKLAEEAAKKIAKEGFHTTQYDLNSDIQMSEKMKKAVSILHSTI